MKKNKLYVSFDESNHNHGNDIIVATFSIFPEDISTKKFGRRDYRGIRNFLDKKGRDYRFTTFASISEFEKAKYNLYIGSIFLIRDFIKKAKNDFYELEMIFDGYPRKKGNKVLEKELQEFEKIQVSNYWGNKKKKKYPILLQAADVTASELYRGLCSDILNSKKIVKFSLEEVLRLKKRFETL